MTDREKLIELMCQPYSCTLADHLIANGVVVREWIPVTERLPEENVRVLVRYEGVGGSWGLNTDTRHRTRWLCFGGEFATVTHWMPLPEPPMRKGENDG